MKYIITGASGSIWKRCAERLLERDDECLVLARSEAELQEIKERFPKVSIKSIDLSDIGSVESIYADFRCLWPFDGLIHFAGDDPLKPVDENDLSALRSAYQNNVFAFIELMRCLVQDGICNDGASVVVMSSAASHKGSNRHAIYSGTKSALEGTIRCMARELIGRRIRVNSVVSGTEKRKQHTMPGNVSADEVCAVIEYLLSDAASHITGASLPVSSEYSL